MYIMGLYQFHSPSPVVSSIVIIIYIYLSKIRSICIRYIMMHHFLLYNIHLLGPVGPAVQGDSGPGGTCHIWASRPCGVW